MEITCPKCSVTTTATDVTLEVTQFGCPNCNSLSEIKSGGVFNFTRKFDFTSSDVVLKIGQKGTIEGIEYTVTAAVVKKVQKHYFWREYILTAPKDEQLYLSETDGHWILLRKVDDNYDVKGYPEQYEHNGRQMMLYDYDDPKTVMAVGFFDYDVLPYRQRMIEYIDPPYIFLVEESGNEQASYFGEHISKGAVKRAFGVKSMPYKSGVGLVQPFAVDLRVMAIVFCMSAITILTSHLYIYSGRESVQVLNENLSFSQYSGKDYVSKPFTLKGGSAPLTINLDSNVDNSWASVQVALINEKNNDEEYAALDVEYYHGYEDGESWSEGDKSQRFNVCGVNAGTYHLVITPQKPAEDLTNDRINVSAEWNSPSSRNVVIPIIIMIAIGAALFFIKRSFEQKRWTDSSYSPFE